MHENDDKDVVYQRLLAKFCGYKERILKAHESESVLYIEPLTCFDPRSSRHNVEKCLVEEEMPTLAFDIRKNFLNSENLEQSRVLFLTGQAGVGKTLFCKSFQKELLHYWEDPQSQENDQEQWFPIYIDHSAEDRNYQ